MEPIPADIVEETWKRVASLSPRRAPGLIKRMGKEQPVVLAYLLAVDHDLFNDDERQLLLYLGVVVWQIMSQGSRSPLPMITEDRLDAAEAKNVKMTEYLQGETEEGFLEATRTMIQQLRAARSFEIRRRGDNGGTGGRVRHSGREPGYYAS